MNIILYLVLWSAVGVSAGVLAHWLSCERMWPNFGRDVAAGFVGGVLGGAWLSSAVGGAVTVYSAFSLLFALAGALALLVLVHLCRRWR